MTVVAARPRLVVGRDVVVRMSRCLTVSVGTTLLSAAVLVALAVGLRVAPGAANVVAVCCGIAPSYLGNRRWVWGRTGRSDLAREVLPFWAMSLTGLAASTVAVARVGHVIASWSGSARAVALPATNVAVFGALWILQFTVLDRVLFATRTRSPEVSR